MENDKWYEMDIPFDEVKRILSANLKQMSISFIAAGYYMKYIRDKRLYLQDGYSSIWEFAESQYGIQKSTASRWMAMNDRFSKDGNSPVLADEYKSFNKSQLQEMLYLNSEQIKAAEPEMSAKEIRAIRKPKKETVAPAQFEPSPDSITSKCYSCVHYSECNAKSGTVKECNEYINKAEAEKTEEQKYNEEQNRIDRETKKKLREIAQEEKMEHLPSETGRPDALADQSRNGLAW